jgi:hypothetical protein
MSAMELSSREIEILVKSLEHCIATCKHAHDGASGACLDCAAARTLRERLSAALAPAGTSG